MITGVKSRLLLTLVPILVVLFGLLVFLTFKDSERTVLQQITRESYELARSHAKEFDVLFESSRKAAEGLALSLSDNEGCNRDEIIQKIKGNLEKNPDIYGSTAAFIPEATPLGRFAPYYFRSGDSLAYSDLDSEDYHYTSWEWFTRPVRDGRGSWSEPYFDEGGGGILMTTYSEVILCHGEIVGIATVDISLDELVARTKRLKIGDTGYAFIISDQGRFIAHPGEEVLSQKTIWELLEPGDEGMMAEFAEIIKDKSSNYIEMPDPFYGKQSWIITTDIQSTGWTFVIAYPSDEILDSLVQLRNKALFLAALIIAFVIGIVVLISSGVTSPLKRLVGQVQSYSEGNYQIKLAEKTGPKEIRDLSLAFNSLGGAIVEQIDNVRKTTAQKERYQQELLIAAEIQKSILPQVFPPFPELVGIIDIYGLNRPALEVGGDFFDIFRLKDNKIALVIADVSDKGAPASLFMAMTRILTREIASQGHSPAEVLRRVNYRLAKDNSASMFVTMLYCEYDVESGNIRFVCAGHNAPICVHKGGEVEQIPMRIGLPLGALPNTHYETSEFTLPTCSMILLYTDGITEAEDTEGREFGLENLVWNLRGAAECECKKVAHGLLGLIDEFTKGAKQRDDITMLLLCRQCALETAFDPARPIPGKEILLRLPAETGILEGVADFTELVAKDCGFDAKGVYQIKLALDEVMNNVIMYAYRGNSADNFLLKYIPLAGGLKIEIVDYGIPFDFDEKLDRYDGKASEDQPIGGIGLYLVKQFADEVHYAPETSEGNKLTIIKFRPTDGA